MQRSSLLFTIALGLALPASLPATITFSLFGGEEVYQGGSGSSLAASNSLFLLVADIGSGSPTFNEFAPGGGAIDVGSFVDGVGGRNLIVYRGIAQTDGLIADSTALTLGGGWSSGDPLAIYWIPSLTIASTVINVGTAYGYYTSASAQGGSLAWTTPNDGDVYGPMYFETLTSGGLFGPANAAAGTGFSNLTVSPIPEPSTYALIAGALALGVLALRRRR